MKNKISILIFLVFLLVLLGIMVVVGTGAAKTSADPQISWSLTGGSGGYITSSNGVYALVFTVGQSAFGAVSKTTDSDTIELYAGFWCLPESWRTYWRAFLPITMQD